MSHLYYKLKPYIPRSIQIFLRRQQTFLKMARYKNVWPIDPKSHAAPTDWHGWPNGKRFAFVLSHDVETEKGLRNIPQIVKMEQGFGFCSSFNFVVGDYAVPDDLLRFLRDASCEIGIHGLHHDRNPFRDRSIFLTQAIQINRYLKEWDAVGFRSPSMYHDLDLVHHLDIDYDASTFDTDPFEPQPDGVGTIFPFWVSGRDGQKGYVELPYTLPQDFLLFILMKEEGIDIWKKKLDWVAEHGGMVLFITHPDYMNFNSAPIFDKYPARLYEEFLDYIKSKYYGQYWHALPKEVSAFWSGLDREQTKMEKTTAASSKKKKVWIDLDNSPHVPFFRPIIEELRKQGYETFLTARDCFQVCGLADMAKLKYEKIGRHYGKNKLMKVIGLLIRSLQLMPSILREKPDLAVSHGSRSQVMTSWLLNVPTVVIADYEYTKTVIKPTYVVIPEMIKNASKKAYKKSVLKYRGIKEDVYVPDFIPDPSILKTLGINDGELLVTIRPPATEAHYHNPESEILFEETINFLGKHNDLRMVILPRNEKKQTAWVRSNWSEWCDSGKIIIPEHVVDGLNLIWFSDFVISGGGTMNREAAALGVPVYSIFRGTIGAVDHYLSENGRLVLLENVNDIHAKIKVDKRRRAESLENKSHSTLEDVTKLLIDISKAEERT